MLMCLALFLYEDQEQNIQSMLENLWVKINDLQKRNISRHTAFTRTVTTHIEYYFTRIFWDKPLSLRSFCVSVCFTIALLYIPVSIFFLIKGDKNFSPFFGFTTGLLSLIYGILQIFVYERKWLWVWYAGFWYWIYKIFLDQALEFFRVSFDTGQPIYALILIAFVASFALASVLFTALLALVRRSIRKLSKSDSIFTLIYIAIVNAWPALLVYRGAEVFLYGTYLLMILHGTKDISDFSRNLILGVSIVYVTIISSLILVSFVFFFAGLWIIFLSLALFTHKLVWPFPDRVIYALQRYGIVKRRMALFIIGLVIICISWGQLSQVTGFIKEIVF